MTSKRKHSKIQNEILENGVELLPATSSTKISEQSDSGSDDSSESDSTDSEESVYSGLEEEEGTTSDSDAGDDGSDKSEEIEEEKPQDDTDDIKIEEIRNETNTKLKIGGRVNKETKLNKKHTKVKEKKIDNVEGKEKEEKKTAGSDEYEDDSSDEEDIRNTVGNIPMEWYKNMSHIGYDIEGRKLIKPQKGDNLDEFLNKVDDPNYWRTVTNKMTGQNVLLTKEDTRMIQQIYGKKHPTASGDDLYAPWVDFFSNEVMIHPLSNRPEHKRSFIPSKWEKLKVGQYVHALKMGWMKPTPKEEDKEEDDTPNYYMLWKEDEETEISKRYRQHIAAPKMQLPGHAESYNPPPEYLFTKEEEEKWKEQEREERRINFIPQKFSNLRSVPAYSRFINERFERCLDLYLCPRQRKMRMNVDPEDLIPKLPKPKDLQPFPTTQSLIYLGHTDMVRCVSVDPSGQWLVSGSDDHSVRVWEVSTGRCIKTLTVGGTVKSIAWNPNPSVCLVALTVESAVILINPGVGDKLQATNTDNMLSSYDPSEYPSDSQSPVTWSKYEGKDYEEGFRLKLPHNIEVTHVTWHVKGDYFASTMPKGNTKSVLIHQLSKQCSQNPFTKSKGLVQCVQFHPIRPFLFVATQRYVRVYNLLKQELSKKLMTNCKWVSSMAVHPEGDNVIIGSYDCRLSWFDLDLSTKPYQTLRHHKKAIRQVCYHKRYPLFASVSDDCSVIVCHGMVYNDLLQNPLIVPVKVLRGHTATNSVGILDCVFHPSQPWIFSAGADGTIRLYT